MGKKRKKQHYRQLVIVAVAVGTVGVPSAAMACADGRYSDGQQAKSTETSTAKDWRYDAHRDHHRKNHRNGHKTSKPSSAASKTATATPSTPKATKPKPTSNAAPHTLRATPSTSATPASPSTPKATATASRMAARIMELVNAQRSMAGCSPLTLNATLAKVAQVHSNDMAAHQNMSHTGADGSSPGDRITSADYNWSTYGENVAQGYATPQQVMAGWMSSAGHRANILNCAFKEIGVGLAQPNSYWTQDFATARYRS
ncbi:CAP domain-containing protein [Streptomyces mirabilis]|uniref:CAP domain-containing protein n=1 Tax=Streptomyces mirabilis TaxID=68239 RepID=UPI0033CA8FDE